MTSGTLQLLLRTVRQREKSAAPQLTSSPNHRTNKQTNKQKRSEGASTALVPEKQYILQ